jgi:RIO kinase 1
MPKKPRKQEDFKTMHDVFDEFTNRTVFKLISEGYFEGLESPISIGKEANLFSARKDNDRVMVKIYRLETCDFNRMYDYIKEDPRYLGLKGKKRKIIFAWVQREYRNLIKARSADVNVPLPIAFKNNILVLEFIGKDGEIAPQLKDRHPDDPGEFLDEIIENMKHMNAAGLVHADLSQFNILNHDEHPVFIDFSQCLTTSSASADRFLDRDIKNILSFFKKFGISADEAAIKAAITNNKA